MASPAKNSRSRGTSTKLLIVDDSALMRKLLVNIFSQFDDFELETARDGLEALAALHRFQPDVISLDINMPGKNGLECLERIMIERPTPVVMFSSLTAVGATTTLEAMALGAVDHMAKPDGATSLNLDSIAADLVPKIRVAAGAKVRRSLGLSQRLREQNTGLGQQKPAVTTAGKVTEECGVVLIGVSTGGPRTLEEILPELPAHFPWPVVVAQHMPASFTYALAKRMDSLCRLAVVEVTRPLKLEAGHVYIAKGDADTVLSRRPQGVMVMPVPSHQDYLWHPSVDLLVKSAQSVYPAESIIGVLLTGMGRDGASEMTRLRNQGGHTIAESEVSTIVNGMPRELIENGGAEVVLPVEEIAPQLIRWLQAPLHDMRND